MIAKVSRRHWIRWLTLSVLSAWVFTAVECHSADRISRTEAVTIAQGEARRIGYSFDPIVIRADEGNTAWHAYVHDLEKADPQALKNTGVATILEQLRTKTYWAVGLSPRARPGFDLFDGTVWVFVDARSGAVLGQLGNRLSKP
jgi:hypothetical protein